MDCVLNLVYSDWFTVDGNRYPFANGTGKEFITWALSQNIAEVNQEGRIPQFESNFFYSKNHLPNYYFRNSNFYFHCKKNSINFISPDEVGGGINYCPVEIESNAIQHVLTNSFVESLNPTMLEHLRSDKVSLLLVNMVDPSLEPSVINEVETFFNNLGIHNIVLLQGNVRYDTETTVKMYDSILSLYQISNEMDRYPYETALGYESDFVREEDITNSIRSKKFLSFNRFMDRPHRAGLAHLAFKHNLLPQGYFSFLYNKVDNYMSLLARLQLPATYVRDIIKLVPYQLDTSHLPKNELHTFFTVTNNKKNFYLDSYVHIVTETQFQQSASPFMSEKTWRPILNLQPFIYLGNHLALNTLIKLGFKTFSPFIDESYDNEPDPVIRFKLIEKEISRLGTMPIEQIHDWYFSILPILIHNQKTLYSHKNYNPIWKIQNIN